MLGSRASPSHSPGSSGASTPGSPGSSGASSAWAPASKQTQAQAGAAAKFEAAVLGKLDVLHAAREEQAWASIQRANAAQTQGQASASAQPTQGSWSPFDSDAPVTLPHGATPREPAARVSSPDHSLQHVSPEASTAGAGRPAEQPPGGASAPPGDAQRDRQLELQVIAQLDDMLNIDYSNINLDDL